MKKSILGMISGLMAMAMAGAQRPELVPDETPRQPVRKGNKYSKLKEMVELPDGTRCRRSSVHFGLQQHPEVETMFKTPSGTIYNRNPDGSMINVLKPRMTKAEKKRHKKERHKGGTNA